MGGRTVEGGEWGPLPMKANAKEASLAGRAGIQLISETRQEGEKALLSDEACVRQGEGQTSQCITATASLAARTSCPTSDMRGKRCRHVDIAYTEGSQGP